MKEKQDGSGNKGKTERDWIMDGVGTYRGDGERWGGRGGGVKYTKEEEERERECGAPATDAERAVA